MTKGIIIFRGEVPVGITAPYMDIPGVKTIDAVSAVQMGEKGTVTLFTLDTKDEESFAQAATGLVAKAGPVEHIIYRIHERTPKA